MAANADQGDPECWHRGARGADARGAEGGLSPAQRGIPARLRAVLLTPGYGVSEPCEGCRSTSQTMGLTLEKRPLSRSGLLSLRKVPLPALVLRTIMMYTAMYNWSRRMEVGDDDEGAEASLYRAPTG
jgi:hypothetical protein